MRYLIILLGLILTISIVSLAFLYPNSPQNGDEIGMNVNGKDFTKTGLNKQESAGGYHNEDREEFLNSVITRELLIQEAQRQKIDKEEAFRVALKEFFEQSLIKTLMDRQNKSIIIKISDEEVTNFLSHFGKTVTFSKLTVDQHDNTIDKNSPPQQFTSLFEDLAQPVQLVLADLQPNETRILFDTGSSSYAMRLDKLEGTSAIDTSYLPEKKEVMQAIADFKRSIIINEWIQSLRKNASIKIYKD